MNWYTTLSIDQKINMKELFVLLCGVEWASLSSMFTIQEKINIMYNKLVSKGII